MGVDGRTGDISQFGTQKRPNVLIIAENASLSHGGESYLPVQWFRELLKEGIDAHLLVHARSKPFLEQSMAAFSSRIHYVPEVLFQTIVWNFGRALPAHVRDFTSGWAVHLITQYMQRRAARQLIRQYGIDVLHQPTPVSPRLPSMIHGLGVPVVIGPMNGNMRYPPGYHGGQPLMEWAFVPIARLFSDFANLIIPGKRRADMLLVANERTRAALPSGRTGRVGILCENGVDADVWRRQDDLHMGQANGNAGLSLVFLGRLLQWKGAALAIDAVAEIRKQVPDATLRIIGDGPERARLEARVDALGLRDAISFHGWISREACACLLSDSEILLFPSVFDCGGAAVLEAMSLGLMVVALNWGGPGDYLAEGGGILIDPVRPEHTVAEMVKAVLQSTPESRRRLGETARARITEYYSWSAKVDQILEIYQSVCAQRSADSAGQG